MSILTIHIIKIIIFCDKKVIILKIILYVFKIVNYFNNITTFYEKNSIVWAKLYCIVSLRFSFVPAWAWLNA